MAIVESDKTFIFIQQAFKVNVMITGGIWCWRVDVEFKFVTV